MCTNENDKLTIANGRLTNPIGIITADEYYMGGRYLIAETQILTMTTHSQIDYCFDDYCNEEGYSPIMYSAYYVIGEGEYDPIDWTEGPNGRHEARPVINIKGNLDFTGLGTAERPYEIVMN